MKLLIAAAVTAVVSVSLAALATPTVAAPTVKVAAD